MKNLSVKLIVSAIVVVLLLSIADPASAQKIPTKMKVVVMNADSSLVEGANVKLYASEEDYRAETNQVGETATTNKKGLVKIKYLDTIPYYVLVEKDKKSNIGESVMTEALQEGKVNKVGIIIK
jgi:hypothetical protein